MKPYYQGLELDIINQGQNDILSLMECKHKQVQSILNRPIICIVTKTQKEIELTLNKIDFI